MCPVECVSVRACIQLLNSPAQITTFRDDMIKISQTQYSFAIRYITSLEQADVGYVLRK